MDVSSQHHGPTAWPLKEPQYPFNRRPGGPDSQSGLLKKKKEVSCLPLPGFDPRTVEPITQDRTLITHSWLPGDKKYVFIYLAGCSTFLHLPAPIWQLSYLFLPFVSVIPVFFYWSLFPQQSSNPFRPGSFRSSLFSSSWWAPFHNFFW